MKTGKERAENLFPNKRIIDDAIAKNWGKKLDKDILSFDANIIPRTYFQMGYEDGVMRALSEAKTILEEAIVSSGPWNSACIPPDSDRVVLACQEKDGEPWNLSLYYFKDDDWYNFKSEDISPCNVHYWMDIPPLPPKPYITANTYGLDTIEKIIEDAKHEFMNDKAITVDDYLNDKDPYVCTTWSYIAKWLLQMYQIGKKTKKYEGL